MKSHELNKIITKINTLENKVRTLQSMNIAGSVSYEVDVVPANYAHDHMPSSIQSGSTASNITFTGTITLSGTITITGTPTFSTDVNFAGGTTYKVEADGDIYFKEGHFSSHIYQQIDGLVHYWGAANDLGLWHDGTNSYMDNDTGVLYIRNLTRSMAMQNGAHYIDTQDVIFRDPDDANEILYRLDTNARTQTIGATDGNDDIAGHHYGNMTFYDNVTIAAGNLIMSGAGGDDERLKVPYLTGVPASVDNGSVWMEADGLHIYYNGAEKVVAGA